MDTSQDVLLLRILCNLRPIYGTKHFLFMILVVLFIYDLFSFLE